MKRILAVALVLGIFVLSGCGLLGPKPSSSSSSSPQSTASSPSDSKSPDDPQSTGSTPTDSPTNQDSYTGDATHLRGQNNTTHSFVIVGTPNGSVWGNDIYTDDSIIATAAVHAGVVKVGEKATVTIRILPGLDRYEGTERNGVTSSSYMSWHSSYEFVTR